MPLGEKVGLVVLVCAALVLMDGGAVAAVFPQAEPTRQGETATGEAPREAIKKFEEAVRRSRAAGDAKAEADALINLASAHERLSDFRGARGSYEQALPLYRSANNRAREAFVLNRLGSTHARLSEYQKAIDFYHRALPLLRAENDRSGEASALGGLGQAYRSRGDLQQALDFLDQSLPIHRALGNRRGEAAVLQQIAAVHFARGESLRAVEFNNQALAIYRAEADRGGQASVTQQLGQSYYHLGEYQRAIDLYGEALEIQRALGNRRGEGTALGLFGQVYSFLGENQRALEHMNQALSIFRALGARELESVGLNNSAHVHLLMGEHEKAIEIFNQALEISRLTGNRTSEGFNLHGLGIVYAGMGDYRKALDFHRRAVTILRAVESSRGQAATLSHIGGTHLSLGEHEQALDTLKEALSLYRRMSVPRGQAQSLYTMARTHRARGDLVEARASVEAAIKIAETFRHDVTSQQLRTSYFASVRDYYELNIDLLMQLDKARPADGLAALALEASERARARTLLDLLSEARTDLRQGVDAALLARELALRQLISAQAERQTQLQSGGGAPEQIAAVAREIEAAIAGHEDVQAKIRAGSPRYSALTQPEPLSLKEIQEQVLDADTLLLEYALGEKRSYLWAVSQTAISGYELPGRKEIEAAAREFYDLAKANARSEEIEAAAARLSRMLLAPAAGLLGKRRLAVVADGALQYLPFAALPRPAAPKVEDGAGRSAARVPLVVEHEIVMLPSASTLAVLRNETKGRALAPKLVAVLADPVFDREDVRVKRAALGRGETDERAGAAAKDKGLVRSVEETGLGEGRWPLPRLLGTRREARTIFSLAPRERSRQALDFEASRETATSAEISQYQIVHFATHALINNRHAELSGLVLSLYDKEGRSQDGFLRLNEIYNLRLPAEMVVLSACQTGLGKDVRGEGLIGLTRGFMYAGSRRLMASLWQVDDAATSELMGRFYRGMLGAKRLSPTAALRAAQIEMWKQRSWRSPYNWAGFVIQGEWK